jgi:hypothetical protein
LGRSGGDEQGEEEQRFHWRWDRINAEMSWFFQQTMCRMRQGGSAWQRKDCYRRDGAALRWGCGGIFP